MLGKKKAGSSKQVVEQKNSLLTKVAGKDGSAELPVKSVKDINTDEWKEKSIVMILKQKGWGTGDYSCKFVYTDMQGVVLEDSKEIFATLEDDGSYSLVEKEEVHNTGDIEEEDEDATTVMNEEETQEVAEDDSVHEETEELPDECEDESNEVAEREVSEMLDFAGIIHSREYEAVEKSIKAVSDYLNHMLEKEKAVVSEIQSAVSSCSYVEYAALKKEILSNGVSIIDLDALVSENFGKFHSFEELELNDPGSAVSLLMSLKNRGKVMSNLAVLSTIFPNADVDYIKENLSPEIFGIVSWKGTWGDM